ncbi:MAG TPA: cation:proton antiporter [Candidatus Nanopelagicales bacterium]|nr:cation:proton antiporter [Candidatus Nanopelagicales bacterium]
MTGLIVFSVALLAWVLLSARLQRWSITAAIVLTGAGLLASWLPADTGGNLEPEWIRILIEATLAVVLFTDASSIAVGWFRREWRYPARLLGIGFPLTFVLGTLLALVLFSGLDVWVAAVIAAALAPTDAALGLAILENEKIPLTFRQVINVESGLNDGLATPLVAFCIALAAADVDHTLAHPVGSAVLQIAIGVCAGGVIGALAGFAVRVAAGKRLAEPLLVPVVPLAVALTTYLVVVAVGGNGFVAAFVAGTAFGAANDTERHEARAHTYAPLPEAELLGFTRRAAQLMALAVWFVFGASVLSRIDLAALPHVLLYAVLSLTVLRMVPVALSAVGLHLPWDTVALAGWLGPRGLASVIFALLAAEEIGGAEGDFVLEVVAVTVALSVVLHGLSAGPLAVWYAARHPAPQAPEHAGDPA